MEFLRCWGVLETLLLVNDEGVVKQRDLYPLAALLDSRGLLSQQHGFEHKRDFGGVGNALYTNALGTAIATSWVTLHGDRVQISAHAARRLRESGISITPARRAEANKLAREAGLLGPA